MEFFLVVLRRYLNWDGIQYKILKTARRAGLGVALMLISVVFAGFAIGFGGFAAFGALSDQIGPNEAGAVMAVIFLLLTAITWIAAMRFFSGGKKFTRVPALQQRDTNPINSTVASLTEMLSSRFIRNAPSLTVMSVAGGFIAGAIMFSRRSGSGRTPSK